MKIRILEISNFKNIGVSELDRESNEKLNSQKLYLNANYSEDAMGGLVLLVGENNTGKSNIIKALKEFSYEDTLKAANDIPNFIASVKEENYKALKKEISTMEASIERFLKAIFESTSSRAERDFNISSI